MELVDVDQDGDFDILMLENYYILESMELILYVLEWIGEVYSVLYWSFLEFEFDKYVWFECDMLVVDVIGNGFFDVVYFYIGYGVYDWVYMVYF